MPALLAAPPAIGRIAPLLPRWFPCSLCIINRHPRLPPRPTARARFYPQFMGSPLLAPPFLCWLRFSTIALPPNRFTAATGSCLPAPLARLPVL